MNRRNIKKWLIDADLTQASIAARAGVSRALVSLYLKGRRNSAAVRAALLEMGCPEKFLGGAKDVEKVA